MLKTYLIVGLICIPSIECFQFSEPKPKHYTKLDECLMNGKQLGDEMFERMNKLNVPAKINVWCKAINQHGEYS